ncbi:MAG TPA: ABC transporter ATP-binding protein [Candidatus Limnocylindrales bacterium]
MPPRIPHPDPGIPDTSGPLRYIWWLVRRQPVRVLRGGMFGTIWMVGLAARPAMVAEAVDDGLRVHNYRVLWWWVAAIVVTGWVMAWLGIMRHRTMTFVREDATARSAAVVLRAVSRGGAPLARRLAAGEVATVGGTDIGHVSAVLTIFGPGIGAMIAYAVVATVLWSFSPALALFVLLGVPAVVLTVGPLLRRLERAESAYRKRQGALIARAGDIVAGLRILAGVGGRSLFARAYNKQSRDLLSEGYRVGAVTSWLFAMMALIPGLFLAAVVWLTARMAAAGEITIGQMVAVYGFAAMLIGPVWMMMEAGWLTIRGRVAARRVVALLTIAPAGEGDTGTTPGPDRPAALHDPDSGLTIPSGLFLGVAAADPGGGLALADRLGRFAPCTVTWGGVPLEDIPLADVRDRILVDEHDSYLFPGTLREVLQIREELGDKEIRAALHAASADDVVDALPQGLDTPIGTRARNLSGGQRQRVRLARALLAEPEVLILLDPTSAVDAHTEARVAERLIEYRAGRTTVVIATSPLLLGHTDRVAHLRGGQVIATGTHTELLDTDPLYRSLVARDTDIDDELEEVVRG